MVDENTQTAAAASASATKPLTLADIDREYFEPTPERLQAAALRIAAISGIIGADGKPLEAKTNHDFANDPLPAGWGIFIQPIAQRTADKGNVPVGVAICKVPSLEEVSNSAKGMEFIQQAILTQFGVKIGNSVRPREGNAPQTAIPETLADFIEPRNNEGSFKTYSLLAPGFVKYLKDKGFKYISAPQLRNILQSAAFAESQYPKIKQPFWVQVLDAFIAASATYRAPVEKKGQPENPITPLDPAVLINWKETRDEAEAAPNLDNVSLDDIGSLIAAGAAPAEAGATS
jgi:hypothetical protein